MYAVFFNRPFYPSLVGEFDTQDEAVKAAEAEVAQNKSENGEHDAQVFVVHVLSTINLKTDY